MQTKLIKIDADDPNKEDMREAAEIIRSGGLVAFPTETVYGLGANALDPEASKRIYAAKGRPSDNPLIVHICRFEELLSIAKEVPPQAKKLADAFWPGPLTMIVWKNEKVPYETTGGMDTVAIRMPNHPVALALIESIGMAVGFGGQGLLINYDVWSVIIAVATMTAGSAFLMWIGERITEKGVGNGISIVLLINIISRVPDDLVTLYTQFMSGKKLAKAGLAGIIILAILLVVIVFVIILQDGERRIAVQYSKKVQGRKTYGGQSSHIPLKVNTAGVIPVIFSSSLMQTPIVIAQFLGKGNGTGIGSKILAGLNSNNWCDPENPIYSIGLVVYILLTIFFAYFYTSITFNPMEIANNMKKSGGFIPGIRPGKPTVDYLTKILNYIIFIGACGLIIVQVIPYFFNGVFGANVSFGGTSLIIIVGVVLETIKKIESQMLVRNYTGFLNNKGSNMKNSYLGY